MKVSASVKKRSPDDIVVRRKGNTDPLTLKTVQVILRGLEKHDQWQHSPKRSR